ncbi:MAG: two-component system sensor histidine kinase NtrB [Hyphomicrobiales bacterium]
MELQNPLTNSEAILNALPHPVVTIAGENHIRYANAAAENFFQASANLLTRNKLDTYVPFSSPLLALVEQVRKSGISVNEYAVDVGTPRTGAERLVDLQVAPVSESPDTYLIMMQERTMAHKIDRQLTHRGAARSVSGMAGMLAHEIKNPLSGIRGAAQLLESAVVDDDKPLTQLICEETDRICTLVDQMEVFSDERPLATEPVNIHSVFERVKAIASTGFSANIEIREEYDPSLPLVSGNRDQLIQVFLNLVKNAAEAISHDDGTGGILLSTAFRPGVRITISGSAERVSLPLEFCVTDNGPGISPDIRAHLFEPFVTSKSQGKGLGLALVAKIVRDHGGIIECNSQNRKTTFRILMPMHRNNPATADGEIETVS